MGRAKICKQFDFHAAHVLPNHDGACARLHGHSYKLEVMVEGWVKTQNGEPDEGMVVDFGVLKDIYKNHVEPKVEHQYLNETLAGIVGLTTCENMAAWLGRVFAEQLALRDLGARVVCVRLWETPTSFAEVRVAQ